MTDRLTDAAMNLAAAATNAAVTAWDVLAAPMVTIWAAIGAMPLPIALAAIAAGLALGHAARQHTERSRKD